MKLLDLPNSKLLEKTEEELQNLMTTNNHLTSRETLTLDKAELLANNPVRLTIKKWAPWLAIGGLLITTLTGIVVIAFVWWRRWKLRRQVRSNKRFNEDRSHEQRENFRRIMKGEAVLTGELVSFNTKGFVNAKERRGRNK